MFIVYGGTEDFGVYSSYTASDYIYTTFDKARVSLEAIRDGVIANLKKDCGSEKLFNEMYEVKYEVHNDYACFEIKDNDSFRIYCETKKVEFSE